MTKYYLTKRQFDALYVAGCGYLRQESRFCIFTANAPNRESRAHKKTFKRQKFSHKSVTVLLRLGFLERDPVDRAYIYLTEKGFDMLTKRRQNIALKCGWQVWD